MSRLDRNQDRNARQRQLAEEILAKRPITGERLQAWSTAVNIPSGKKFLLLGVGAGVLSEFYLLAATDKRIVLILISMTSNYKAKSFEFYQFNQVHIVKVKTRLLLRSTKLAYIDIGEEKYRFQYSPSMVWDRLDTVLDCIKQHQASPTAPAQSN